MAQRKKNDGWLMCVRRGLKAKHPFCELQAGQGGMSTLTLTSISNVILLSVET